MESLLKHNRIVFSITISNVFQKSINVMMRHCFPQIHNTDLIKKRFVMTNNGPIKNIF